MPVRVYLEDTDAQGVVYNASYFRFMERARTDCLRARGIDHDALRDEHGANLVLARIEARFVAPARLSDMLRVTADVIEIRGARMRFKQCVFRDSAGEELLCDALAEVACMDAATNRPKRFPAALISEWK
jgi:tol-pal system-associated acyl-CoA thioesterase